MGALEARLSSSGRWRRALLPAAAAGALAALAVGGWLVARRLAHLQARGVVAEAEALLAQDDAASLGRSIDLLGATISREPSAREAIGDRAVARTLAAAALEERAQPLVDRLEAIAAQRDRLASERPAGHEDAERALAVESARLQGELAPLRRGAEAASAAAREDLGALLAEPGGERFAARGLALDAARRGDPEQVARAAGIVGARGAEGWIDLAEAWIELRRGGDAGRAIGRLEPLVAAHPDLVRARWLLARAQLLAGQREAVGATLDALLAVNPRHDRALQLRALLLAAGGQSARGSPPRPTAPGQAPGQAPAGPASPPARAAPVASVPPAPTPPTAPLQARPPARPGAAPAQAAAVPAGGAAPTPGGPPPARGVPGPPPLPQPTIPPGAGSGAGAAPPAPRQAPVIEEPIRL